MNSYICLGCGTVILARKEDMPLEQRRCGSSTCRSRFVISYEDYETVKAQVKHRIATTPGLIPYWDIFLVTFGVRLRPRLTLALMRRLYIDITREQREGI